MKEYDEIWAVDAQRIRLFFRDHPEEVTVLPLPERMLGSVKMPQTRIIITGEHTEELHHQLVLHFMTAGG